MSTTVTSTQSIRKISNTHTATLVETHIDSRLTSRMVCTCGRNDTFDSTTDMEIAYDVHVDRVMDELFVESL